MSRNLPEPSRRERQIMDVIYRLGSASVAEVREQLQDAPGYSAVRALLRILVEKGHLRYAQSGPRYVYTPTVPREAVRDSALDSVVQTFFGGSPGMAAAALLGRSGALSDADVAELERVIARARGEGR